MMIKANSGTSSIGRSSRSCGDFNVPQKGNTENDIQHSYLMTLFMEELEDIYWAEKALTQAIPMIIMSATSTKLIVALENHLVETKEHVKRVEKVFEILGKKALPKKCEAIKGLIKEAQGLVGFEEGSTIDAGIIFTVQKIELYEIATYGILCELAESLGFAEAAALLQTTLNEETEAVEKLTEVFVYIETFRSIKKNQKPKFGEKYFAETTSSLVEIN